MTRVRDGDTIKVDHVPIRFGSLDCAERDAPEGMAARRHMQELISGRRLVCDLNGRTSHDRKIGSCMLDDGRDLASIMIREGVCGRFW
ncbi:thermonuclease family protein [Cereibacter johrii]|uniref:thermonuclease family protein n=1 Tax=Cereibacter johrii TaxID=445629 RepID=UPI003CF23532